MSKAIFKDREHAGDMLAKCLAGTVDDSTLIVSVPNGGVPIAKRIREKFQLPLYLILSKKIPLSNITCIGLGAISEHFNVYNAERVNYLRLPTELLQECKYAAANTVETRKKALSHFIVTPEILKNKNVILVDDGIASGYTVIAAIRELQYLHAGNIVVATPVITTSAKNQIEKMVNKVQYCYMSDAEKFVVDDFYESFTKLTHEDVIDIFKKAM